MTTAEKLATALHVAADMFEAWEEFLSAQQTIDNAGFMDNYTDAARARERQAKAIEKAKAALSKARGES